MGQCLRVQKIGRAERQRHKLRERQGYKESMSDKAKKFVVETEEQCKVRLSRMRERLERDSQSERQPGWTGEVQVKGKGWRESFKRKERVDSNGTERGAWDSFIA